MDINEVVSDVEAEYQRRTGGNWVEREITVDDTPEIFAEALGFDITALLDLAREVASLRREVDQLHAQRS